MTDDEVVFHCDSCYKRIKTSPEVIQKRHETTELHREEGVFLIAVCNRCGGVLKPYLNQIENTNE